MREHIDTTLRECRMLLTMLRTPKLRQMLVRVLAVQDDQDTRNNTANAANAAASTIIPTTITVEGPLRQLSWLHDDGTLSNEDLTAAADDIKLLLGDTAILEMPRITQLPSDNASRIRILTTIIERVFTNLGPRPQLSEPELNARLAMLVDEVAVIRRYAVDYGILKRSPDGSVYWYSATAKNTF